MNIVPLADTIVIKTIQDKLSSIIVKPDTRDKDRATKGQVIAAGPGKREDGEFIQTTVKKGDVVVFHSYPTGLNVKHEGAEYKLIPAKQIMAVLR